MKERISLKEALTWRGRAAFPLVEIPEEDEIQVRRAAFSAATQLGWDFRAWMCTQGLVEPVDGAFECVNDMTKNPQGALNYILDELCTEAPKPRIYMLHDFRKFIDNPMICRTIRDMVPHLKRTPAMLIFAGPGMKIPPELEREVVQLHLPMPDEEESVQILRDAIPKADFKALDETKKLALVNAGAGLNFHELECAYALAASQGELSPRNVWVNKARVVSTSELQFVENTKSLDHIGGLEILKEWITRRAKAYTPSAREYGLPAPLGCVLLGPPGTGKSEFAKAVGEVLDAPEMRFSVGNCMRPHVGESERLIREVMERCDSFNKVVLWIDEFEKAFAAASTSGQSDSGLFKRMFGEFLTWLSERRDKGSQVFVVATCNAVKDLDSALTRAGRFDVIWYIDLPTTVERRAIAKIHTSRFPSVDVDDKGLDSIAQASRGYSGAEIAQAIYDGMFVAFDDGERPTTAQDILDCLKELKPSSELYAEELREMERWKKRTKAASLAEAQKGVGRRNTTKNAN
jgi:ATP-dependent 26S proteasome regulatory subunit